MSLSTPSVRAAAGVVLSDLTKSFRSADGVVHAVRGIDIAIAPGETVALLGPNGAGKSTTIDMLLGLLQPDAGSVSLFGRPPADSIKLGAIGAMLQTGSLIRDLSVRELVTMMASLYPHPMSVDEVIDLTGIGDIQRRRTQKLAPRSPCHPPTRPVEPDGRARTSMRCARVRPVGRPPPLHRVTPADPP